MTLMLTLHTASLGLELDLGGMGPEQKVKVLEKALYVAKTQLAEERKLREQIQQSKQNLEVQVRHVINQLNEVTKGNVLCMHF
jgi:hypothetical protein